jgi:transposase-like protein
MQDPIIVDQTPAKPPRRTYTKEFKIDAVAQCERGDRSLAQVAMDLRINANLVRRWQRELQGDFGNTKLLPVQVAQPASTETSYIELSVNNITIKVVGAVESNRVADLVRALR